MNPVEYIPYADAYFEAWFDMSARLFAEYSRKQLEKDLKNVIASDRQETFLARSGNTIVAFINVSIRHDYVEGSTSSPVGYLEALYVDPNFRKIGIARRLYELGERWAFKRGCTQMGSDTWAKNTSARRFHRCLGFEEDDILVHFIKDIDVKT